MKMSWDKIKVGDIVECKCLGGNATVYHADHRGVFVYSEVAADIGMGHDGSASGVEFPIKGQKGHWNFWKDMWPWLTVVKQAKRFKGNN